MSTTIPAPLRRIPRGGGMIPTPLRAAFLVEEA
jgi:hypothetical protein